jgi:hypothetical protein
MPESMLVLRLALSLACGGREAVPLETTALVHEAFLRRGGAGWLPVTSLPAGQPMSTAGGHVEV